MTFARQNIERFKAQLKDCFDESKRRTFQELLAAEEKKIRELESGQR